MGSPFTETSVSNYNSNPPSDDGAQTAANRVQWSTGKTKLTDPIKTAFDTSEGNTTTAFGKVVGGAGVTSTATDYTVAASDQGKLVKVTASATITTPDATSVGAPFVFEILNLHTSSITLDGNGSQTINGSTSIQMASGDGYMLFTDGTNWFAIGRKVGVLPRGYIDGCILSNGTDATNDIDISAGSCRDSTNAVDITVPAISGKQLDANWSVGGSAGMRNSAAGIADGTYHLWAVRTAASETGDIYAHTSATAATVLAALQAETGGASYAYLRRIGSIVRASSAILLFKQFDDKFLHVTRRQEVNATSTGTSRVSKTLSYVPSGIIVTAILNGFAKFASSTAGFVTVGSLFETDAAPDATNLTAKSDSAADIGLFHTEVVTDVSAGIFYRMSASGASDILVIICRGWIDRRGKDA